MIPVLFPAGATTFLSQGLGSMLDAQDCTVTWRANGMYELELQYPVFGRRYQDLQLRRIILATAGPDETAQPFRIYRITKPLLGIVTVYARHIFYDLMGYTVVPFQAAGLSAALDQLQSGAVTTAHPFTFATTMASDVACNVKTPRSIWSMLGGQSGSLLDVYGRGEWDFDGFTATLRRRLGSDNGVQICYGTNLQSLEQDENMANVWTGVHPYWADAEGNVVTLPERVLHADGDFGYTRILVLDLSAEWTEPPTEDQLRARAEAYMTDNDIGSIAVSLDVSFVPLDQTEEYKGKNFLSKIHKGDTVYVGFPTAIDRDTGRPTDFVTSSARAVKTVWKPFLDRYEKVYLGSVRTSFVLVLAQVVRDSQ